MSDPAPDPAEADLIAALRTLRPTSELPGLALFKADVLERAGIDLVFLERWAGTHGGGLVQAGSVKPAKGKRLQDARPGKPQGFYAVPLSVLE